MDGEHVAARRRIPHGYQAADVIRFVGRTRAALGGKAAPSVYDGLAGASGWLQGAGTAVLPAVHTDPVQAADTDLLRAIPAAMVPPRLGPGAAGESVSELCHGITVSAARLRAAVRGSPERAT